MAHHEIHVLQDPEGDWRVESFETDRVYGTFETREEAIVVAREICDKEDGELIIHEAGGEEEDQDVAGIYPYMPRNKDMNDPD